MKKILTTIIVLCFSAILIAVTKDNKLSKISDKELISTIDSLMKISQPVTAEPYFAEAKKRAKTKKDSRKYLELFAKQISLNQWRYETDEKIYEVAAADTLGAGTPLKQAMNMILNVFDHKTDDIDKMRRCLSDIDGLARASAYEIVDPSELMCEMTALDFIATALVKESYNRELKKEVYQRWTDKAKETGNERSIVLAYMIQACDDNLGYGVDREDFAARAWQAAKSDESKALCYFYEGIKYANKAYSASYQDYKNAKTIANANAVADTAIMKFNEAKRLSKSEYLHKRADANIGDITRMDVGISIESHVAPYSYIPVFLEVRNVDEVTVRIYKDPNPTQKTSKKYNELLPELELAATATAQIPACHSRLKSTLAYFEMDGLPFGHYIAFAYVGDSETPDTRCAFQVTDLAVTNIETEKENWYSITSATTGKPVVTATIGAKKADNLGMIECSEKNTREQTTVKNQNDKVVFSKWFYGRYNQRDETSKRGQIITDRAVYRPGQSIEYKAYIYNSTSDIKWPIKVGTRCQIVLTAANGLELGSQTLTTNEFGTVSGKIAIPDDAYKGFADLTLKINNNYLTSESVRIEEYKRTNNTVTFSPIRKAYLPYDSVDVECVCKSADGHPLSGASVKYEVTNWIYDKSGMATTDNNGKCIIRFRCDRFNKISVDVTDLSGETTTATTTCSFTPKGSSVSVRCNETVGDTTDARITLASLNSNGMPFATKGKVRIDHLIPKYGKTPEAISVHYYDTDTIINGRASINIDNRYSGYTFDRTIYEKELDIDSSTVITLPTKNYPSGAYKIRVTALAANGSEMADSCKFTIVAINGRNTDMPEVYLNVPEKATFGQKVDCTIGSGLENAQILVVAEYANKLIYKEIHTCSQETKTITLQIPEMPKTMKYSDLHIVAQCVMANRSYREEAQIQLIEKEKPINFKLSTWRDKSTTGAKETWTITVLDTARTEIAATMYDARLDKIRPLYWETKFAKNSIYSSLSVSKQRLNNPQRNISNIRSEVAAHNYSHISYNTIFDLLRNGRNTSFNRAPQHYNKMALMGAVASGAAVAEEEDMILYDMVSEDASYDIRESVVVGYGVQKKSDISTNAAETGAALPMPRTDFRETAFFFPTLYPDAKGKCTFSFTLPDNITTYNFRALAHDKSFRSGYISNSLSVSKLITASLGLPRFATEGDTLEIWGTITSNDKAISKAVCTLEVTDTLTHKAIETFKRQNVSFQSSRSQQVVWRVVVPQPCAALKFKLTATADKAADAEENTIPIEPRDIEVAESESFVLMTSGEHTIANPFNDGRTLSLSFNYTSNAFMEVLKALPHLSNDYFPSSDTYLGQIESSAIAMFIGKKTDVKNAVKAFSSNDSLLHNALSDNASQTPWLYRALQMEKHNHEIVKMLKGNYSQKTYNKALGKLYEMQNDDGSFPWFKDMDGSKYLTSSILSTFGWLIKYNMVNPADKKIVEMCRNGQKYLEREIKKDYADIIDTTKRATANDALYELYAYTSITNSYSDDCTKIIEMLKETWTQLSPTGRIMAAHIILRSGDKKTADIIAKSLSENLVEESEHLAHISVRGYHWYENTIQTQAMLILMLRELRPDDPMTDRLVNWLIMQKRSQWWPDTQSTSRAVMALLTSAADMSATDKVSIGERQWICTVRQPVMKASIAPDATNTAAIISKSDNRPSWGAWQRIAGQPIDDLKAHSDENLTMERVVEVERDGKYVPADKCEIRIGDVVKITIEVKCNIDIDFVHISDRRAAGLEPLDKLSGYRLRTYVLYSDQHKITARLFPSHYFSPGDKSVDFFISELKRGQNYTFYYETRVNVVGNMAGGYSEIECMYCPDIKAHSDGRRIRFTK
ncbi:MAG: hypothetical protein J6Y82_00605 [Bacteroidales bacterium]|nr:hypothetical protein [Bacteroidales bacterium]